MAGTISVPERAFDTVRRFATVSDEGRSALHTALMDASPMSGPNDIVKMVEKTIGQEWTHDESTSVVSEAFSMSLLLQESYSPEEIAQTIAGFPAIGLDDDEREAASAFLSMLISSRLFTNLASAASVHGEHDRLFLSARVFVDTRQVFDLHEGDVVGAVVARKLRLAYFENGRATEIEIALDDESTKELKKALETSDTELAKTRALYHSINLPIFKFSEDED